MTSVITFCTVRVHKDQGGMYAKSKVKCLHFNYSYLCTGSEGRAPYANGA